MAGSSVALWCSVATATILAMSVVGVLIFQSRRKKCHRLVGQVSGLWIYPVKSCRGISLQSADCTTLGLRQGKFLRDRIFMLIAKTGNFVSARQEHRLLLAVPSFEDDRMLVDAPGMETLRISLSRLNSDTSAVPRNCRVWGTAIRGYDCGDDVALWFQRFLGKDDYRLVYYRSDLQPRLCIKSAYKQLFKKQDAAAYSDLTPYLLISESSVEDLNSRLPKSVTTTNFRPNITVSGCIPYDEDNWKYIRIGENVYFRNAKPCTRCLLTTINPQTAEKDDEPLKTLKSYRQSTGPFKKLDGDAPLFGIGLCVDVAGKINVGDPLYVF